MLVSDRKKSGRGLPAPSFQNDGDDVRPEGFELSTFGFGDGIASLPTSPAGVQTRQGGAPRDTWGSGFDLKHAVSPTATEENRKVIGQIWTAPTRSIVDAQLIDAAYTAVRLRRALGRGGL